jgi:gliding motility-associated transport system ATP-binding protein
MIKVEHLTKYYGTTRAVEDVSFNVPAGAVAALLGPNGSGKSTLMRVLTGYLSPTSGRVSVGGIDVADRPLAARRQIGYLPEQVSLYPELTVQRFLAFVAAVKGLGGAARRAAVADVMERCGLTDVARKLTGKLSKCYRQRVGLAQALIGDPPLLVLDEPTVGLDPVQTVEMRGLLRGLSGRTVLLSTHILSEASALCSHILILDRGHLLAEDTPEGLARRLADVGHLTVRVDGPVEQVAAALAALPGVTRVDRVAPDGQPGTAFAVVVSDPEPVQRRLAAEVVGRGWTLLEVHTETPTLEDLFVRVVAPGEREAAAAR